MDDVIFPKICTVMVAELDCPVSLNLSPGFNSCPKESMPAMTQDSLVCGHCRRWLSVLQEHWRGPGIWLNLQVSRGLTAKEAF